jgi:hypothetical protein
MVKFANCLKFISYGKVQDTFCISGDYSLFEG